MSNAARATSVKSAARTLIRKGLSRFGLVVYTVPKTAGSEEFEAPHTPLADYTPWNMDAEFQATYDKVRDNTVVDLYRCWELWSLVAESAPLSGALVEVGVWRGGSGALIARQAQLSGITDPVFLCDTFEGVVKAGEHDPVFVDGELADTSVAVVEKLATSLGLDNVEVMQGIFPEAGMDRFADMSFRLCHIDVDVYQSAKEVTEWIWERMVDGGIIVFDDYGFNGAAGVTKAVEDFAPRADCLRLYNLNGHAILVKRTVTQ